jgi:hypothetical protein
MYESKGMQVVAFVTFGLVAAASILIWGALVLAAVYGS